MRLLHKLVSWLQTSTNLSVTRHRPFQIKRVYTTVSKTWAYHVTQTCSYDLSSYQIPPERHALTKCPRSKNKSSDPLGTPADINFCPRTIAYITVYARTTKWQLIMVCNSYMTLIGIHLGLQLTLINFVTGLLSVCTYHQMAVKTTVCNSYMTLIGVHDHELHW